MDVCASPMTSRATVVLPQPYSPTSHRAPLASKRFLHNAIHPLTALVSLLGFSLHFIYLNMDSLRQDVVRKAKPIVIGYTTFNFTILLLLVFLTFQIFDVKRILREAK